jgi:dUTP pyrophosphatase
MHRAVVNYTVVEFGYGEEPRRAYSGDAGSDLYTASNRLVMPRTVNDVPTGIRARLPEGYYARIVARSSTFRNRGLLVVEGIIDNGYTGELFVCVYNPGQHSVLVEEGERLAQLILCPIVDVQFERVDSLGTTERGNRGFGSSGR